MASSDIWPRVVRILRIAGEIVVSEFAISAISEPDARIFRRLATALIESRPDVRPDISPVADIPVSRPRIDTLHLSMSRFPIVPCADNDTSTSR